MKTKIGIEEIFRRAQKAFNAWSDLPTALRYMARYEPYDPYWIEEPFGPDDIDNHARLAERTPVIVATGEIEVGRWRFKELLEKDAAEQVAAIEARCQDRGLGYTPLLRVGDPASERTQIGPRESHPQMHVLELLAVREAAVVFEDVVLQPKALQLREEAQEIEALQLRGRDLKFLQPDERFA